MVLNMFKNNPLLDAFQGPKLLTLGFCVLKELSFQKPNGKP